MAASHPTKKAGGGRWRLRKATLRDRAALESLIARSARELSAGDYTPEQVEGALQGAFGVDTQLITDGTYYVAVAGRRIIGCGGWSRRKTLFGGDASAQRDASRLDPVTEAARIRAFFVDPGWARRGVGTALLERCEADARGEGFHRLELMGTLPGLRLYEARGFVAGEHILHPVGPHVTIEFVPMTKELPEPEGKPARRPARRRPAQGRPAQKKKRPGPRPQAKARPRAGSGRATRSRASAARTRKRR